MRFLVDAQLPPAVARWIADRGYDALHVADVGLMAATDTTIWAYAIEHGYTIISKDEDFARRRNVSKSGPAIVWICVPNQTTRVLLVWFESAFPNVLVSLNRGEAVIALTRSA
jgi:predicted nuclease of predicted toxin-antitoxin system